MTVVVRNGSATVSTPTIPSSSKAIETLMPFGVESVYSMIVGRCGWAILSDIPGLRCPLDCSRRVTAVAM